MAGARGPRRLRVVVVRSWGELPRVLEPGVYIVGGERHTIREPVEKEVLLRAVRRAAKRGVRV